MQTDLASYIDHTLLKPTVTYNEVEKLCEEAVQFGFAAVCIPPASVLWAGLCLDGSAVKLATVIGFPFGYSALEAKLAEIEQAVEDGSDELDVVINLIALKNGNWAYLETEMAEICALAKSQHQRVKAIIETGVLTPGEIIRCCELYPEPAWIF
jgi:deoxyribose-phosphate aldolase